MKIYLSNNTVGEYTEDDILVLEKYSGRNNRWDEMSIIFKDKSIIWFGCGLVKYVIDGKKYIENNRITQSGLYSSVKEEYQVTNIEDYDTENTFLSNSILVTKFGILYDDNDEYHYVWESKNI